MCWKGTPRSPGAHSRSAEGTELARLGNDLSLLAASLPQTPLAPGAVVTIPFRWRVLAPTTKPLNVFVHLGPPEAPPLAGADAAPCGHWYGTDEWHAQEIIEHSMQLALPAGLAPGEYPIFAGVYDWVSGERLPVAQANGPEPDRVWLGSVRVGGE